MEHGQASHLGMRVTFGDDCWNGMSRLSRSLGRSVGFGKPQSERIGCCSAGFGEREGQDQQDCHMSGCCEPELIDDRWELSSGQTSGDVEPGLGAFVENYVVRSVGYSGPSFVPWSWLKTDRVAVEPSQRFVR